MIVFIASALALLSGLSLGLLGGGGSILTVPILVYVLRMDTRSAIASSLAVVAATSAAGALLHWRQGRVRANIGLPFAMAGTAGGLIGIQLSQYVTPPLLLVAFAVLVLGAALAMMRPRSAPVQPFTPASPLRQMLGLVRDGFGVGLLTGLVGAGGGFMVVPALSLLGGLSMADAVGTSLLVIAITSSASFLGTRYHGVAVDWGITAGMSASAVMGSLIGVRLGRGISPGNMRRGFGVFISVLGVFILAGQLTVLLPLRWAVSSTALAVVGMGWLSVRMLRIPEVGAPALATERKTPPSP